MQLFCKKIFLFIFIFVARKRATFLFISLYVKGVFTVNIFFKADTPMPLYLPYPRFLLGSKLSCSAKEAYMLLLERARISQQNGWVEAGGNVFVIYPLEDLAADLGKSISRVVVILRELDKADLIVRKKVIFNGANRINLKLPQTENNKSN